MSLGNPAHALNLQTNVNGNRYLFATTEAGEQQLYLSTSVISGISTQVLGISGSQGNEVQYTMAPNFTASEFIASDQGLATGTGSTYWTLSSINAALPGTSISYDREAGAGITCIENYRTNGSLGGFEFLTRGVNAELTSTNQVAINNYMSSIGRPGALGVLGASGTLLVANTQAAVYTSLSSQPDANRVCFAISDLSGANGVTVQPRWTINTINIPTGGNVGSDFNLYGWSDNGSNVSSALAIRRLDQAMAIPNISSIATQVSTGSFAQIYPMNKNNVEFGAENDVAIIAGASNQATPFVVLFSTPMTNCNPNGKTFLNMNWINMLSTQSASVNYKVGFSTSTAYTNTVQSSYIPAIGGSWTPSDLPGLSTPVSFTNFCGCLDPDGVNADGSAMLYIAGQFSDPHAAADQIYIAKNTSSEATRYALSWRPM